MLRFNDWDYHGGTVHSSRIAYRSTTVVHYCMTIQISPTPHTYRSTTSMILDCRLVVMREKLVMILIALGQAHGSQFAPLVVRARGSVV